MDKEKKDGEIEEKFLPGQLELGLPAFEKYPRTKRHWMASTPVVDDIAFLSDPLGEEKEGPEDEEKWPYGDV